MENTEQYTQKKPVSQSIDFYKIFRVFFSRWYWIAGTVIIALCGAWLYLWYTPPIYQTGASLKLEESSPSSMGSGSQTPMQNYSYTDKIQAESFTIRSNEVIMNAVKTLDYKVSYYLKGRIRTPTELYPKIPFIIEIIKQDSVNFSRSLYEITAVDDKHFELSSEENKQKTTYAYDQQINAGNMIFRIKDKVPSNGVYQFKFNSKEDFIGRAMGGLNIGEAARFTNVMSLSQTDGNAVFAADILNAIMKEYVKYDVIQRRRSARQTVDFIDNQLGFINTEAGKSGSNLANYKTQNRMVDMTSSTTMTVGKLSDFEKQKTELNIKQLGIRQLEEQINNNRSKVEIGLDLEGDISNGLGILVGQLNTLLANREIKLNQFNAESQPVKQIDQQIANVKANIKSSIQGMRSRNEQTIRYIDNQIAGVNQSISTIPVKEQNFVKLQTNFEVNNKVRSFLSEKKLEAQMNAAAIVPGASIVNPAYPSYFSISPDSRKIYSTAIFFGLAAGFGLILLVRFLNPYIYDKETVEGLTHTPIIGVIRKFPDYIDQDSRQALSISKPKSVFAESVRSVRTNLSFLASHKKSKTICITSEISGEGKSFVTVNLASTLALIEKKVILIAADLRKSKLHKAFGSDNKKGLSTLLSEQHTLEEVLVHDEMHHIDFIPSGPVPPNPSELLHTDAMKKLLDKLSPIYDYILVDTAPVGLVSDAIPLIRKSDVNLFVIRSGVSQQRAAAIPERLSREYGLSNLAIILNAFGDDALYSNYYTTDYSRGGGNSTYYYSDYSGYSGSGYYEDENRKWWMFWKKK
ncbi:GumC family protein [Pedobacter punctiformis]|uniref:non-specific protein-tyrosine kinase n=1 Tax=Pedobacter punctiformis TaxID=3004097 RepID=A0ABT4L9T3_9SPHI|nr:polysaccharide biosynthesis tyrosine autokinase [Pedobacter sp. HCMS5-2]MCZ4244689.1 polysaccharide biosynthesis tyrosine autokinase [Pedobacter sp. HCMS5-2]